MKRCKCCKPMGTDPDRLDNKRYLCSVDGFMYSSLEMMPCAETCAAEKERQDRAGNQS